MSAHLIENLGKRKLKLDWVWQALICPEYPLVQPNGVLRPGETVDESEEVQPGVVFDYDPNDRVVGIEIADASKVTRWPQNQLSALRLEAS
ncbi:MAG TPA: DUF2283 domain-containing protein [Candidatus Acidoferrales bacterium]|nr:DUF2283 domain-containing protein [Candidatus Acidoferrales bacterium]